MGQIRADAASVDGTGQWRPGMNDAIAQRDTIASLGAAELNAAKTAYKRHD